MCAIITIVIPEPPEREKNTCTQVRKLEVTGISSCYGGIQLLLFIFQPAA
jgi:hypothetical protein